MTVIPDPNTSSDMLFIAVEREGVTTIEVLTRSSRRNSRNSYHLDSNISIPYGGLDTRKYYFLIYEAHN
jgi:hypothetical protein